MCIEALDQLAYPVSTLQSCFMRSKRPRLACCYCQQRFGSTNPVHSLARCSRCALEFLLLLLAQLAQGLFLRVCHSLSPLFTPRFYHFPDPRATPSLVDPLSTARRKCLPGYVPANGLFCLA